MGNKERAQSIIVKHIEQQDIEANQRAQANKEKAQKEAREEAKRKKLDALITKISDQATRIVNTYGKPSKTNRDVTLTPNVAIPISDSVTAKLSLKEYRHLEVANTNTCTTFYDHTGTTFQLHLELSDRKSPPVIFSLYNELNSSGNISNSTISSESVNPKNILHLLDYVEQQLQKSIPQQ
jgi:hypothetical protein